MGKTPTNGPYRIYAHPVRSANEAKAELINQVDHTDPLSDHLYMVVADGKCVAITGCGPTSEANARLLRAAPEMLKALRNIRARYVNTGGSSPLWCDMAEDMDSYAFEGLLAAGEQ